MAIRYADKSARELRTEERTLEAVLATGTLPGSNIRALVDRADIRTRLREVRDAIGPRAVMQ